jgi:uncharacterized protein
MSRDKDPRRSSDGRLAGPTADHGSPEEFAGVGEAGELPEWSTSRSMSPAPAPSHMKSKLINESGEKTFALIFEKNDEVIGSLRKFAAEHRMMSCHFTGIGAFSDVVLGFFDRANNDYKRIVVNEQVEVLSLIGDITFQDDVPRIHAHVVVGKADGTAHGGHLIEGHVFPTLEMILIESPKYLQRRFDNETGLSLIDLDAA